MFDQLVESTSERKNAKILTLFLVNSVLGALVLFTTVVIGIIWYDAQLNYEFEKLALVAMAPPAAAPPPPPAPAAPTPKDTPVTNDFVALTKPPTEIPASMPRKAP